VIFHTVDVVFQFTDSGELLSALADSPLSTLQNTDGKCPTELFLVHTNNVPAISFAIVKMREENRQDFDCRRGSFDTGRLD
jgi:hypothetical protein